MFLNEKRPGRIEEDPKGAYVEDDVMIGGGTKAAEIKGGRLVESETVGGDRLLRYVAER